MIYKRCKLVLLAVFLPLFLFPQKIKKRDLENLFYRTYNAIIKGDSIAFIDLWEHSFSSIGDCEDHSQYLLEQHELLQHYQDVRRGWLQCAGEVKLKFIEIDKPIENNVGAISQSICYYVQFYEDKNKMNSICVSVCYQNERLLYCVGSLLPDKLLD